MLIEKNSENLNKSINNQSMDRYTNNPKDLEQSLSKSNIRSNNKSNMCNLNTTTNQSQSFPKGNISINEPMEEAYQSSQENSKSYIEEDKEDFIENEHGDYSDKYTLNN